MLFNSDGSSYVEFGNGTFGAIPGNFSVYANYAFGGRTTSNISVLNKITSYGGADSDIVGVSNSTVMTGGGDAETMESAKQMAPLQLKARDKFITDEDGVVLSESYPGVEIAKVNRNYYGLLSVQVLIIPSGGGLPPAGLKTDLDTYLSERSLPGIDIRVEDPTYVPVSITAGIHVVTGYVFANIKSYITLALRLIFSEVTAEYKKYYEESGIEYFVTLINSKWVYSFTSSDYTQIQSLIENIEATYFEKTFHESDISSIIDVFIAGVDYITISAPALPIITTDQEITQDNINPALITEIP
jgi:hypothetical protein